MKTYTNTNEIQRWVEPISNIVYTKTRNLLNSMTHRTWIMEFNFQWFELKMFLYRIVNYNENSIEFLFFFCCWENEIENYVQIIQRVKFLNKYQLKSKLLPERLPISVKIKPETFQLCLPISMLHDIIYL